MTSEYKITITKEYMDELTDKYKECSNLVDDIIAETRKMREIMNDSYKGYASKGLDDLLRLFGDHLDVLQMCYEQLSEYTRISKEILTERDLLISKIINAPIIKKVRQLIH